MKKKMIFNDSTHKKISDQIDLVSLICGMPKAELHLHIEGTLEPALILELAARNKLQIGYQKEEDLHSAYAFNNLQSFLDVYYAGTSVLVNIQDFYDMTWAYFKRAKENNIVYSEIFFDLQTHTARGIPTDVVIKGISSACKAARKKIGVDSNMILCFLRHLSEEEAFLTLDSALPYREHFIGVGLDSNEVGNPPRKFERVFARCRDLGFHLVAHAGEEGPSDYIWEAIDFLKVERVDHGIAAVHDQELMKRLCKTKMPLTVCPLSNFRLRVIPDLREHPIKNMLEAGLCVTVNSDDPAYFGGYVNQNFLEIFSALSLEAHDAFLLARNSFLASFAEKKAKQIWISNLENFFANT